MRLQFDDLTIDTSSRQLWLSGAEVHLSPKAFDLLALIIDRRPQAVSKADLHARLWPNTFVTDSSLPSLISEIREAVGDRRRKPPLIRTVHGFGYAFQFREPGSQDGTSVDGAPAGWLIGDAGEIALVAGDNVLGREGAGVILLKSSSVSRRHARLRIEAGGATVEDLGSKNGTDAWDCLSFFSAHSRGTRLRARSRMAGCRSASACISQTSGLALASR